MKTEEHHEAAAAFLQKLTTAVVELKEQLQHDYEQTYPGLGEIIRNILDEEEAKAWNLSFFPHLFLPDLVEAHVATLRLQPANRRHENTQTPSPFVSIQFDQAYTTGLEFNEDDIHQHACLASA